MSPHARRMTNRLTDEERAAIRQETLAEVRSALNSADDFAEFKDSMFDDPQPELSYAQVAGMSVEEVIEHKSAVDAALARGPGADAPAVEQQQPPTQRLATGMQPLNAGGGGGVGSPRVPLSRSALAAMSHEEITSRKAEIDAWLSSGGANR